ncbi:hypothetical protein T03_10487, partial [Trichinella britovi]
LRMHSPRIPIPTAAMTEMIVDPFLDALCATPVQR